MKNILTTFRQTMSPTRDVHYFWIWMSCIVLLTALLAVGTIGFPISVIVFLTGLLLCTVIFFKLEFGILASIFFFFLLFRLDLLAFPSGQKFAEVIYAGSSGLIVVTFLVWQFRKAARLEAGTGHNPLNILFFFFISWACITLLWSKNLNHGLNMLFSMGINLLLVQMLCVLVQSQQDIYSLLRFLIVLGLILSLTTIGSKWYLYEYEYRFTFSDIDWRLIMAVGGDNLALNLNMDNMRAAGFAPANHAAFGLNIFIFTVIAAVFNARTMLKKGLYLLLVMLMIISLILTGSKGGVGSMLIGLAVILLANPAIRGSRISWNILFGVVIICSIIIALMLGEGRLSEAARSGQSSEMTNRSLSARVDIWKRGFEESDNSLSLFFGYGLGTSAEKAKTLPHMHSFYFSAILDLGIIGLALYLGIILYIAKLLITCIRTTPSRYMKNFLSCFSGALVASLINGLVMAEFCFPFFWILLGVILAVTTRLRAVESVTSHGRLILTRSQFSAQSCTAKNRACTQLKHP
ncbi:MAG: hypothetical protein CSA32_03555 [Desulfobulbus propionicus]|nr:MAG: hypothetical protein CSA32_03555 [Desulfobulbus propionicus]